ncbi:hypothetical protein ACJIZ3_020676 [Penstemon smallii]|uniref:Uncharacterized protein n=1 Tax=Penstemon smallii TaxID=265156 RepID=A0ABD3SK27_9LAMI
MSKKSKGLILGSLPPYGEDAKSRLKHQSLMQDFLELEKETYDMRSKLEAAKQRKLTLAAEVRFLRRKYKCLVETKTMNLSEEHRLVHPPKSSLKQTKTMKEQHRLPPVSQPKSKKRRYAGKELPPPSTYPALSQYHKKTLNGGHETNPRSSTQSSILNQYGRINIRKENVAWNTPVLDLNQKEKMHIAAFDLNQDSGPSGKETYFPTRAPIFDLNEISTGDEDFQSNVEAVNFDEAKKSLIRGLGDEQQNDLKLALCRNSREGSTRVGKRKISWQDPVALRV